MRPIKKSDPEFDQDGNEIEYSDYQNARGKLISELGEYCSYCEMHLDSNLAVEHILAQNWHPDLENMWSNFILSCVNCNSNKRQRDNIVKLENYFWPNSDNTFRLFDYLEDGRIKISETLPKEFHDKAKATLELTGLHKTPLNDPKMKDRRWTNRREKWQIASNMLTDLRNCNTEEMKRTIVQTAKSAGYWSVWMTVFKDNPDMLHRFISEFKGTCVECFDDDGSSVPRNPNGL